MPITPVAPTVPPVPVDGATAEDWVAYRWAVSERNRAALAEAQAATAAAMAEGAAAQRALVVAMDTPPARAPLTQGDVVRLLLPHVPQRVSDTDATYAAAINGLAARLLPIING